MTWTWVNLIDLQKTFDATNTPEISQDDLNNLVEDLQNGLESSATGLIYDPEEKQRALDVLAQVDQLTDVVYQREDLAYARDTLAGIRSNLWYAYQESYPSAVPEAAREHVNALWSELNTLNVKFKDRFWGPSDGKLARISTAMSRVAGEHAIVHIPQDEAQEIIAWARHFKNRTDSGTSHRKKRDSLTRFYPRFAAYYSTLLNTFNECKARDSYSKTERPQPTPIASMPKKLELVPPSEYGTCQSYTKAPTPTNKDPL